MPSRQRLRYRLRILTMMKTPMKLLPHLACAAALFCTSLARAEAPPSPEPEIPVPSLQELMADPIGGAEYLLELSNDAERAEKEGDLPRAVKYFTALSKMVPDRALSFAKLCALYQELHERDQALLNCRQATGLQGVKLADYLRYLSLLVHPSEGQAITAADVAEADAVLQHLEQQAATGFEPDLLRCELGLSLSSPERLRECIARLEEKQAPVTQILPFRFSLTLLEKDFGAAERVIARAREAGLPEDAITMMQDELERRDVNRPVRIWLALGALVLASGVGAALWRRRRLAPAATTATVADLPPVATPSRVE
jgi:hypothetical protein